MQSTNYSEFPQAKMASSVLLSEYTPHGYAPRADKQCAHGQILPSHYGFASYTSCKGSIIIINPLHKHSKQAG